MPAQVLDLFEDLFECCPESMLATLFPLFERTVLAARSSTPASLKDSPPTVDFNLDQITKTCRKIMTKLTMTHDL